MASKNDSDARRLEVQFELEMLFIENYVTDRSISDDTIELSKLVEYINVLAPQCAPNSCSNSHKIHYFCHAVFTRP